MFDIDQQLARQILNIFQANYNSVEVPFLKYEQLANWLNGQQLKVIKKLMSGAEESTVSVAQSNCKTPANPNLHEKQFTRLPGKLETAFGGVRAGCLADTGVDIWVASAYRSPAYQAVLILGELHRHNFDAATASRLILPTALSEHGSATNPAIDISDDDPAFMSKAYPWLATNAGRFGFYESYPKDGQLMDWEPWHWRFRES